MGSVPGEVQLPVGQPVDGQDLLNQESGLEHMSRFQPRPAKT